MNGIGIKFYTPLSHSATQASSTYTRARKNDRKRENRDARGEESVSSIFNDRTRFPPNETEQVLYHVKRARARSIHRRRSSAEKKRRDEEKREKERETDVREDLLSSVDLRRGVYQPVFSLARERVCIRELEKSTSCHIKSWSVREGCARREQKMGDLKGEGEERIYM